MFSYFGFVFGYVRFVLRVGGEGGVVRVVECVCVVEIFFFDCVCFCEGNYIFGCDFILCEMFVYFFFV